MLKININLSQLNLVKDIINPYNCFLKMPIFESKQVMTK